MDKCDGISQYELINMQINSLFVIDSDFNLCTINEPWDNKSKPACKFYLSRTLDGQYISRFRADVPAEIRKKIDELCRTEPIPRENNPTPIYLRTYLELLNSESYSISLCFYVPRDYRSKNECGIIDAKNVESLTVNGFGWLVEEVEFSQPCSGVVLSNQIVSVCRSVRITEVAHEAGIETLDAFRGNGYALDVLSDWAKAVRSKGAIPLYSTDIENKSSQRIAEKEGLYNYGIGLSVE